LKKNAMKGLVDQGMMNEPLEIVIHENIMPWLLDQMADFLVDEDYIDFKC